MGSERQPSRGLGGSAQRLGRGLGRARTLLTSPGGCDETGMEPVSGRETWPQAKVNALGELLHRTRICSSSARRRHVWETRRVSEWIPNTLQVARQLGECLLLPGGESHSLRDAGVESTFLSMASSAEKTWDGNQQGPHKGRQIGRAGLLHPTQPVGVADR